MSYEEILAKIEATRLRMEVRKKDYSDASSSLEILENKINEAKKSIMKFNEIQKEPIQDMDDFMNSYNSKL